MSRRSRILAALLTASLLIPALIWLGPRPGPQRATMLIEPGTAGRRLLIPISSGKTGKPAFVPRTARQVDFHSSAGSIDLFVVPMPGGTALESVEAMRHLYDLVANGERPENVIAEASGDEGTLVISRWPFGWARYLLIIRAHEKTEADLTIHFGR